MSAVKLDPDMCRRLAGCESTPVEVARQLSAAADLAEQCDLIALQFDAAGIDRTLPLAHQAEALQEKYHALVLRERQTEALAEQRLITINDQHAQMTKRPALTEERVRKVVTGAVGEHWPKSWPTNEHTDLQRKIVSDAIADRAAKELAGSVVDCGQPVLTADEVRAGVREAVHAEHGSRGWGCTEGAATGIAIRVAGKLAHLTLDQADRDALEDLRDSDCVTEDEAALLTRLLGATP